MGMSPRWLKRVGAAGQEAAPKYKNRRVYETPDGLPVGQEFKGPKKKVADSKAEYERLLELRGEVRRGEIQFLQTQAILRIEINGFKICSYVADFRYVRNGRVVVEDVKGMLTPVYKLKKKLVKAVLGIDIVEITRRGRNRMA
jgi:hypothetical protein